MNPDNNRRRLLAALAGMLVTAPTLAGRRLLATPAQSAGPFYPLELPLDDDNDLTRVVGRDGIAAGRLTELTGRVLDLNASLFSAHLRAGKKRMKGFYGE